uniref:Uncharacterized protein n=1 Tax=Strix occidentalis caurina TaxID=311401 RepID=A0A8D0FHE9_STROC
KSFHLVKRAIVFGLGQPCPNKTFKKFSLHFQIRKFLYGGYFIFHQTTFSGRLFSNSKNKHLKGKELEQLCGKQVTATDTELERVRWDFVLARLKYEHEDNEKQRLHEDRMEQSHQQASVPQSQGLQDVLQPLNQYALFLYCFIVIHVIYTVKDLAIYFFQTHYLFCFAVVLSYILKKIFQDCKSKKKCS